MDIPKVEFNENSKLEIQSLIKKIQNNCEEITKNIEELNYNVASLNALDFPVKIPNSNEL